MRRTKKQKPKNKKVIIFWHTDSEVKRAIVAACRKQKSRTSYSNMATRIFKAALKNPKVLRAA